MLLDFNDDQSPLVQVMAWCRKATSHYLSQCWPRFLSPYGVTRPQWVKILCFLNHTFDLTHVLWNVWNAMSPLQQYFQLDISHIEPKISYLVLLIITPIIYLWSCIIQPHLFLNHTFDLTHVLWNVWNAMSPLQQYFQPDISHIEPKICYLVLFIITPIIYSWSCIIQPHLSCDVGCWRLLSQHVNNKKIWIQGSKGQCGSWDQWVNIDLSDPMLFWSHLWCHLLRHC